MVILMYLTLLVTDGVLREEYTEELYRRRTVWRCRSSLETLQGNSWGTVTHTLTGIPAAHHQECQFHFEFIHHVRQYFLIW